MEVKFTKKEKYILDLLVCRQDKEFECEKYAIEAHPTYTEEETARLEELRLMREELTRLKRKIEALETTEEA